MTSDARTDWEARIGLPSSMDLDHEIPVLPAPTGLRAEPGVGQVTLHWDSVPGAVGYQVLRATDDGLRHLDHAGGDVLAVPHGPYADTTGTPGVVYRYAVATVSDVSVTGPAGPEVLASSLLGLAQPVQVVADVSTVVRELPRPWRPMIGSEHLSLLLSEDSVGGQRIADDLASALTAAHDELGVAAVRAHAILCDDLGVYREVDGEPLHDFTGVDARLRPAARTRAAARGRAVVHAARPRLRPEQDGVRVRARSSRRRTRGTAGPRSSATSCSTWSTGTASTRCATTGRSRCGTSRTSRCSGAARATSSGGSTTRPSEPCGRWTTACVVGGPSTAAAGWVDGLLDHVASSGAPLDFVSTHTYGNAPLDLRPTLERYGRADAQIWWTEWGVSPTHFGNANDGVFSAAFLARGMHSAAGRIDALSYWVVSDHFEELGRPPRLLHGGFGLRTVGELRKPRWWALYLLEQLGRDEVAASVSGDGAGSLVEAWASRDGADRVAVALWNGTLDQSKVDGSPALHRTVALSLDGLPPGDWRVREYRVDAEHSNITSVWSAIGGGADWPDDAQWAALRDADRLTVEEYPLDGVVHVELPNPSIVLVEVVRVA